MTGTARESRHGGAPEGGFSLTELLVVVVILGVVAAVAIPSLSPSDASRTALAASEVASALRFARDDARRTGQARVVEVSSPARVRVFELDTSVPGSPAQGAALRHPVDKGVYDLDLNALDESNGVTATTTLPPGPPGMGPSAGFDARGEPVDASDLSALAGATVDLSLGSVTRRVTLEALTGRVTETAP